MVLTFALLASCLPKAEVVQAPVAMSVAVVSTLVTAESGDAATTDALTPAIARELSRRNLSAAQGKAEDSLKIEADVRYFSQMSGRYRWTVSVVASIGGLSDEFEVPVFLEYDREREEEALQAAAPVIARRVGSLLDHWLKVKDDLGALAPAPGAQEGFIYLVMPDRFARGGAALQGSDPAGWHGGNLAGVIEHLDQLRAEGVGTLWLTPIATTRGADFMGHGAFHGYWTWDLSSVDPRFGSEDDVRRLSAELAARDMDLVVDMVFNHVGYEAPLLSAHPDWFHPAETITDWNDADQLVNRQVHGLPDLDQANPEAYSYLLDASRYWLDLAHPAGFRIDAVRHLPLDFTRRLAADLEPEAGPGFFSWVRTSTGTATPSRSA